jgi:RNA polymerase sigma-70 factor (ECF subfamily)
MNKSTHMKNKEAQFKNIIDENEDRIKRICRYYAPNDLEMKDIYQEILVNIWKSLENFRGESALSTWVYRIAVNTSLSYTGKAFKRMKLHVNSDFSRLKVLAVDDVEEKQIKENQLEELQTELNQLSVIEKAIMSLVLEGLNYKEISEVIGITEPNVRVKIHRIKDSLRKKLNSDS